MKLKPSLKREDRFCLKYITLSAMVGLANARVPKSDSLANSKQLINIQPGNQGSES